MLVLILAGCSRPPARPFEKIAILRFDNQTGDSNQAWISTAAAKILLNQLTGAPRTVVATVDTVSDGYLSGATRLVHGYFDGPASYHISIEDLATHKMVVAEDLHEGLLAAMDKTSHLISPDARAFSASQEDNVAAWGMGNFEQAVQKDPGFSAAWLDWLRELMAQRNGPKALEVADRALAAKPGLRSPVDRVQIEMLASTLRNDESGRLKALDAFAHLAPLDVQLWRTLAEAQMNARHYPEAVTAYQQALQLEPQNAESRNLIGYALGLSGDLEGAKKAFADYGNLPNQRPNSLDSLGEVYFLNGKFADAEATFRESYKTNPTFLSGGDLLKAAYAQWLGGNLEGADQTVKEFLIARVKQHDALTTWREAVWLFATGREAQASASLERSLRDDDPAKEVRDLMEKQIAEWKNRATARPGDLNTLKTVYEHTPPTQDGLIRTFYARALLQAGRKDEAKKLVVFWPLPEAGGDPLFQAFLYPTFMEVKKAVQQ